ncbi:hypothetical protein CHUAL_012748 [Chamberlinius hualienensis]
MINPRLFSTLTTVKYLMKCPRFAFAINPKRLCQNQTVIQPESLSFDDKITKNIRSSSGFSYDHHLPQFISICKELQTNYSIEDDMLINAVTKQPILSSFKKLQWLNTFEILSSNGLDSKTIFSCLSKCPQIVGMKDDHLFEIFKTLRMIGLSGKSLKHVISGAPELLTLNAKFIESQFKNLMSMFPLSDLKKLFWMCPNIIFDDIEETEAKLRYLVHEVRVKHENIANSTVLSLTLRHIKKRFEFCIRTGYYKLAHPKRKLNTATIEEVMDIPLKDLVVDKIGVNWEEFLVFESIFERQNRDKDTAQLLDDDESEDDEDTESEDDSDSDSERK